MLEISITDTIRINRNGSECVFVHLKNRRGVKLYLHKNEAHRARRNQGLAFQHGVGPEVLSRVRKYLLQDNFYFGYETEVLKITFGKLFLKTGERDKLNDKLESVYGKQICDLHSGNLGRRRKNGELLLLDFGDASFS